MNYELAKKLKDAGFRRPHSNEARGRIEQRPEPENYIYYPTLEELIEACGISFGRLDYVLDGDIETWVAYSSRIQNEMNVPAYIFQSGDNPSEAVAKLWLAISG